MALPDLFPFEKLVPVYTALEITGCSQYFPHTKPHGNLPVLQHLKKVFPGIFKGSEKHIVKIIISFFREGTSAVWKVTFSLLPSRILAASGQERDREYSRRPSNSSMCRGYFRQVSQSIRFPTSL